MSERWRGGALESNPALCSIFRFTWKYVTALEKNCLQLPVHGDFNTDSG